ncbi:protein sel-1 homolog 2 isoform X7 [Macrotis lagotis]|uniref:protein sel-1 homolog 2 isoform X7 n=1 Tax=Macrotis lagotis TaxID=92651 RepID=UPI003D694119
MLFECTPKSSYMIKKVVHHVTNTEAEKHHKKYKERNVTSKSILKDRKNLSNMLEKRKLLKIIHHKENDMEKKKIQRKEKRKGTQVPIFSKRYIKHLKRQARRNRTMEGERLFELGTRVLKHSKSHKEKEEAFLLFARAADMGNLKAMETMADALLFGDLHPQNISAAIALYESLANEGSHKAQNALGFLSSYGIGIEHNQAKALVYYTFGSAGGSMMSQMILGYKYLSGINVLQNCEAALFHYKNVASYIADKLEKNDGVPVEKVRLAERPENLSTNSEILDWDVYQYYRFLAERGDIQIQVSLGQLHLIGRKGLEQDFYKALYYFLKAAKAGSANAMAFLGKMYLEGNPAVPQSNITAFKYFSMAANKGNAIGLHGLGLIYFHGKGVPVLYKGVCELGRWAEKFLTAYFAYKDGDINSSLVQYALLAEMGYEVAQSNSAFILESQMATILKKDQMYPMALLLWHRAAVQGNAFARIKIGDYHYYGYGTKKDYQTAVTHYSIAVDKYRSAQAMFNLAYMYEHGLGISKDIHLARRLYDLAAETSPDAHIPVFLALLKLEMMHLIKDFRFYKYNMKWRWLKLENTLGPNWDLFFIGLIIVLLIILLRNWLE